MTENRVVLHAVKMAFWQVTSSAFIYLNCGVLGFWIKSTIECSKNRRAISRGTNYCSKIRDEYPSFVFLAALGQIA